MRVSKNFFKFNGKPDILPENIDIIRNEVFPLTFFLERKTIPAGSRIIISDVDKTYLNTDFESLKGLLWIPFEVAVDKVTLPYMDIIYQGLRFGTKKSPAFTPLFFVTASPPSLFTPLRNKMGSDGVQEDGIVMKDQKELALRGDFRQIKEQFIYKLFALFVFFNKIGGNHKVILLGDDTETDLKSYLLFKKIVEGDMPFVKISQLLIDNGIKGKYLEELLRFLRHKPLKLKIEYIFINLTKNEILPQGSYPPVVQYNDTKQLATFLYEKRLINDYYYNKIFKGNNEDISFSYEWLYDYGYLKK